MRMRSSIKVPLLSILEHLDRCLDWTFERGLSAVYKHDWPMSVQEEPHLISVAANLRLLKGEVMAFQNCNKKGLLWLELLFPEFRLQLQVLQHSFLDLLPPSFSFFF